MNEAIYTNGTDFNGGCKRGKWGYRAGVKAAMLLL